MNVTDAQSRLFYLLEMDQLKVDADLGRYRGRLAELICDIRALLDRSREQRSPDADAEIAHLRMIQAHEFCEDEMLPPEVQTFYVALAAEKIARDAERSASEKGCVAALSRQMEEIRLREGLEVDDYSGSGEGSGEYHQLAKKQEELLEKIEQTVIVFLLRRYHLDEQAKLYEMDRETFEVQREVGRILMTERGTTPEKKELLDGYIGKTYGHDAVERVLSRLTEIRRSV